MELSIVLRNQEAVSHLLAQLSGEQYRAVCAQAVTDTAFEARRAIQAKMVQVFDRPTPYLLKSIYVEAARPDKLSARIAPENQRDKIGVDPQKILQAQEFGGARRDKRSEVALRRIGILPNGYITAIPQDPYLGSDDGRGNLRGAFVTQLLSYLQAFSEVGSSANMTDKRKARLHKGTAKQSGRRYFVSYGRLRGDSHLPPGIWAASGTGGCDVRPVLMFVKAGTYKPRLNMESIAKDAGLQDYLDKRLRFRIRQAAGV